MQRLKASIVTRQQGVNVLHPNVSSRPPRRAYSTYAYQEVCIATVEVLDLQYTGQRLLECEWPVQLPAEFLFYSQRLEDKDTHANDALLRWIVFGFDGVVQDKDYEVSRPVCVNEITTETLVALQKLPEQCQGFRCYRWT